jgi:hypothetical protein
MRTKSSSTSSGGTGFSTAAIEALGLGVMRKLSKPNRRNDDRVRSQVGRFRRELASLSVAALLAVAGGGCSQEAAQQDPLDCGFADYVYRVSAPAMQPIAVEFAADWGKAPSRVNARVMAAAPDRLSLLCCGRDAERREWELQAAWLHLPVPPAYPLDLQFVPDVDIRDDAPDFSGNLSRCSREYGCAEVERSAFARKGKSNVTGASRVEVYDPENGRFVATLTADPGEPRDEPPTRIELNFEWDPAELRRDGGAEYDAGGHADAQQ